jgi:hypothetical protein
MSKETFDQMLARVTAKRTAAPATPAPTVKASTPPPPPKFALGKK